MSDQRKPFYKRRVFFIPAIVLAIPAVAFAWWLGSPLFLNKTVIEPFPTAEPAPALVEQAAADRTLAETSVIAPDEPAPPPDTADVELEEPTTTTTTTATQPPEAVALLTGSFKDADSRHKGSGDATIFELGDGSRVLRVENLDVTNGPDLHVFLAPVADASQRADVMAEGYLDLGELKGNRGDQNYPIVGELDLERQWTVVIYCVPFHVIFSTAPLA